MVADGVGSGVVAGGGVVVVVGACASAGALSCDARGAALSTESKPGAGGPCTAEPDVAAALTGGV
jgi:hypothetical protein